MRVLVVEDEALLAESLVLGLRREGMAVDLATDGHDALELVDVHDYDVVVLDRDIPGVHGDQVCRTVVTDRPDCRVLMVTAAGRLADRVEGLRIGSDDYLVKPFDFPELVARLHALFRRSVRAHPPVLTHGDLRLDPRFRDVRRGEVPIRLTRKEFAVLELLMRAGGGVVSAEELLEKAWDAHVDPFTNAVRITVSTLRRKLGEPMVLETVTGVGYRLTGP
ncbi:response regulator transcription factor [Pseudonocardia sp. HH130630-07]|uniref:response regulator transcription factor n=1 Tax=Pseudonocardia sp. HH130630-07 TaxID=1690815 RepID=UPI0008152379|nr:response regulator transcription factor [Pseudonocardia sp. HH130630-07]ANY08618.1 two-component system response regulator [Pseudonocardia sp. HH130630-07]